jgi:glycosyltransferase involved in cell wall biosynthesis
MNRQLTDIREQFARLQMIVIVPTYNNSGTLASVIDQLLAFTGNVMVINDGSTDETSTILKIFSDKVQVITYSPNRGKGYAMRKGFIAALKQGFRYAITIDSDGQHYASDLPRFVSEIEKYPDSILIGNRGKNLENQDGGSNFANRFSNFWFSVQTGIRLPDTQSGYRLYPLRRMGKMKLWTRRYEAEIELLVFSAWRGIRMRSVPISVYYAPPEDKVSHFRPFQDFFRISLLNSVLVFLAIIYGYPSIFIRKIVR